MKAIYACKLYKTSTRQDKIRAAIENPLNAELITQLSSYLDDEYKEMAKEAAKPEIENKVADNAERANEEKGNTSSSKPSSHGGHGGSMTGGHSSGGGLSAKFDKLLDDEESDSAPLDEPSGESAEVELEEVSEASNIPDVVESATTSIGDCVEEVRGLLNANADTAGINRVLIKDSELWIYYNDNINLNNVMGQVIELLSASGYSYLEFNRLARSENAMVFQISLTDTGKEGDIVDGEQ